MARLIAFLVVALVLAGCAGSDPAPSATPSATPSASDLPRPGAGLAGDDPYVIGFALQGDLGPDAATCVYAAACAPEVVDGNNDVLADLKGGNLTSFSVNLTWTASSEATRVLGLGVMVMQDCESCNGTTLAEVTGPSPLLVSQTGLSVPVSAGMKLHLYLWNPQSFGDAAGQGFVYATPGQPFALVGNATLRLG